MFYFYHHHRRQLADKVADEQKALQLCQTKVRQRKLPMEVVDAEYQLYGTSFYAALIFGDIHCSNRDRKKVCFGNCCIVLKFMFLIAHILLCRTDEGGFPRTCA